MPTEEKLTFSEMTKRNLSQSYPKKKCCRNALACGIYLTSRSFAQNGTVTEPSWLCELLCAMKTETALSLIGEIFTGEREVRSILECENCLGSFLKGAFLCCATITDPSRSYHLEFSFSFPQILPILKSALEEAGFAPKQSIRKNGQAALYLKDSEGIADFLQWIGAQKEAFSILNEKIRRDLLNSANRQKNCDTANIDKMVAAAQVQIEAIERLQAAGMLSHLPSNLQETARLRCENPELSLPELAAMHSGSVSKSGVNHRLQKMVQMAKELE